MTAPVRVLGSTAPPRLQRAMDGIALAAAVSLSLAWLIPGTGLEAWRHDSLYYLAGYGSKAVSEGRWLLWILHGPLTSIPGGPLWLGGYLLFGAFAFRLARVYRQDRWTALVFGLLAIQIPSVFGQSLWPVGTFPGPLLLLGAAWIHDRMPLLAFYGVFGVLFFGVSQQYYFFLPLLHVPWVLRAAEGPLRATIRLLGLWVAGFLAGAIVALIVVYVTSGNLGFPIPAWRDPHYVTGLASLAENMGSRLRYLGQHLALLADLPAAALGLGMLALLGGAARRREENLVRLVVFGAVGAALYAVTVAVGVRIQFRTATPLFFALLAIGFLGSPGGLHRLLYPAAALAVIVPFGLVNLQNLRWYQTVTDAYRDELLAILPRPAAEYSGLVVVHGTARALQRRIERERGIEPRYIVPLLSEERGVDLRWRPSAVAAGFRVVRFCGPACRRRLGIDLGSCVARNRSYCIHGHTPTGYLLLSFVDP